MTVQVVTHRILVKPLDVFEEDEAYKAARRMGLDLSLENKLKREQQAIDRGTVLSWGPTAFSDFNTENPLQVGDTVVYARHSGKEIEDKDIKYVVLNDEDIVAIIREDSKNV